MNIDAVTALVANLRVHFSTEKMTAEQEGNWVRSLARVVGRFPPDVIKAAADRIIETRTFKTFPVPADIIKACEAIEKARNAAAAAKTLPALQQAIDLWSTERIAKAYELCRSSLGPGRRAAIEGWALRLWNWCRVNQRHPNHQEIERLKREAEAHKVLVGQCVAGRGGEFSRALAKLGVSMRVREDKIATEIER